ncbi:hypothetical protein ACI782_21120 [Geodermatophilus sp. SYSU D00703]
MVTTVDQVPTEATDAAVVAQTLRIGHGALLRALQGNTVNVPLPVLGTVRLPPLDSLVWFGGLATLAAVGVIEWPVAAAIGVGHLLVQQEHFRILHDFGEGLVKA